MKGAEIQVHCWVYRAFYVIQHHYDIVAKAGPVERICQGGGGLVREEEESGGGGVDPYREVNDDPYADPYDPYDSSWGYDDFCEEGSGGAEDGGGGTHYQPGDLTGGETVEWGTGIGTGQPSVCGAAAEVEYICIDYWVDGEGWVEWSCGYATTC